MRQRKYRMIWLAWYHDGYARNTHQKRHRTPHNALDRQGERR